MRPLLFLILICVPIIAQSQNTQPKKLIGKVYEVPLITTEFCNIDSLQVPIDSMAGKELLDRIFIDSYVEGFNAEDWDFKLLSDGTYIHREPVLCDGFQFVPSGTWSFNESQISFDSNEECPWLRDWSIHIKAWLTQDVFYECPTSSTKGKWMIFYKVIPDK